MRLAALEVEAPVREAVPLVALMTFLMDSVSSLLAAVTALLMALLAQLVTAPLLSAVTGRAKAGGAGTRGAGGANRVFFAWQLHVLFSALF